MFVHWGVRDQEWGRNSAQVKEGERGCEGSSAPRAVDGRKGTALISSVSYIVSWGQRWIWEPSQEAELCFTRMLSNLTQYQVRNTRRDNPKVLVPCLTQ